MFQHFLKNFRFANFITLFLILEKMPQMIFYTKLYQQNNIYIFIYRQWFILYNKYINNSSLFYQTSLIEHSIINYIPLVEYKSFNISPYLTYYIYYNFFNDSRFTVFSNNFFSVNLIWKNSIWLERESSEMYGYFFKNSLDTRRLLLEYSSIYNPLLKSFHIESSRELYYNIFAEDIVNISSTTVEL